MSDSLSDRLKFGVLFVVYILSKQRFLHNLDYELGHANCTLFSGKTVSKGGQSKTSVWLSYCGIMEESMEKSEVIHSITQDVYQVRIVFNVYIQATIQFYIEFWILN